jgi:hypothetical protein
VLSSVLEIISRCFIHYHNLHYDYFHWNLKKFCWKGHSLTERTYSTGTWNWYMGDFFISCIKMMEFFFYVLWLINWIVYRVFYKVIFKQKDAHFRVVKLLNIITYKIPKPGHPVIICHLSYWGRRICFSV